MNNICVPDAKVYYKAVYSMVLAQKGQQNGENRDRVKCI